MRYTVETEVRYEGYIELQRREAGRLVQLRARKIPEDLDYGAIEGLSREVKEKLMRIRPANLGMAGRIPGVTPAAIAILNLYLELHGSRRHREA